MKPFKEAEGYAEELQAAYDYYGSYSPFTARRFLAAYEEAVDVIARHPFVSRPRRHSWRQFVISRYPGYSIFYKEFPDYWLLGGIVSTLRDPDMIQAQLLIAETGEEQNLA